MDTRQICFPAKQGSSNDDSWKSKKWSFQNADHCSKSPFLCFPKHCALGKSFYSPSPRHAGNPLIGPKRWKKSHQFHMAQAITLISSTFYLSHQLLMTVKRLIRVCSVKPSTGETCYFTVRPSEVPKYALPGALPLISNSAGVQGEWVPLLKIISGLFNTGTSD